MLLRKLAVTNARSFLHRAELVLDGQISIIIGPNGGGKTNLLDIIVISIRRHLQSSFYFAQQPTTANPNNHTYAHNDTTHMALEKHSLGKNVQQIIEISIEVTARDVENMKSIFTDLSDINGILGDYPGFPIDFVSGWGNTAVVSGDIIEFTITDGHTSFHPSPANIHFFDYIHNFENLNFLRSKLSLSPLTSPILYLPINRSQSGIQSSVSLGGFNEPEQKRQIAGTYSRQPTSLMALAVGKLAMKRRLLELEGNRDIDDLLRDTPELTTLTTLLSSLGYEWSLKCINAGNNQYDLILKKQGISFDLAAASSGERELFNYIFSIFVLNIRDALIVVDEPELHLHPRWQTILLNIFETLALSTGNQFLLATHSAAFVSPQSIQYISRVFSQEQNSNIKRLSGENLPEMKHLFNIINSQNNEKIFFADKVILVEGISDRIIFDAIISTSEKKTPKVIEIIEIGGKGFFAAYKKTLDACGIEFSRIADLDYIEQVGSQELRALFKLNSNEIKKDVIDNVGSLDGSALVERINEAMTGGEWGDARSTWDYIKSRRRQLIPDLSTEQITTLNTFITSLYSENIFILKKGSLEKYLPEGYRKKDLQKLILFVTETDFLAALENDSKEELQHILALAAS